LPVVYSAGERYVISSRQTSISDLALKLVVVSSTSCFEPGIAPRYIQLIKLVKFIVLSMFSCSFGNLD